MLFIVCQNQVDVLVNLICIMFFLDPGEAVSARDLGITIELSKLNFFQLKLIKIITDFIEM